MDKTKLASLFPIPLYSSEIVITDTVKDIVKQIQFERIDGGSANISVNKYILNEPGLEDLRKTVDKHVQDFGHKIYSPADGVDLVLKNSWIMEHPPGDYNFAHFHINSLISGVLYIEVTPNSGDLVFQKSNDNLQLGMLDIGVKEYNSFNSKTFRVTPEEGQILIFPSNLFHRAETNRSDSTRYCLAFNYFVKGTLGKGGPEELIIL
jgi:uncharacterized protein (TIGR02466 family)